MYATEKGSRTAPHEDNSPPDKNKAQPLATRTTIPRTIPHQDNSPLGPLPQNKTHSSGPKLVTVGNCPPGELSGYDRKERKKVCSLVLNS